MSIFRRFFELDPGHLLGLEVQQESNPEVARLKLGWEAMSEDFCLGSPLVGFQGSAED